MLSTQRQLSYCIETGVPQAAMIPVRHCHSNVSADYCLETAVVCRRLLTEFSAGLKIYYRPNLQRRQTAAAAAAVGCSGRWSYNGVD